MTKDKRDAHTRLDALVREYLTQQAERVDADAFARRVLRTRRWHRCKRAATITAAAAAILIASLVLFPRTIEPPPPEVPDFAQLLEPAAASVTSAFAVGLRAASDSLKHAADAWDIADEELETRYRLLDDQTRQEIRADLKLIGRNISKALRDGLATTGLTS